MSVRLDQETEPIMPDIYECRIQGNVSDGIQL